MIVATILLAMLVLVAFPFPFLVQIRLDLEKVSAKIVIRIGSIKIFLVDLRVEGGKIVYLGTINGEFNIWGGSTKTNFKLQIDKVAVVCCVNATTGGDLLAGLVGMSNAILYAVMYQAGVNFVGKVEFGNKFLLNIAVKGKVSLLNVVGVG